ncbi:AbrB/MazE/SpoVT family DNA-binding domain-containing protein [Mycobacterium sp. KBS0706]|uniref:antitoxin n=1 Tax=Mycobacterium sp. KBS0706 TaxID=2578109 RepID=UPI00110FB740|nr:AbrB/MazE/SpoVT family DNA-binding domain-containing protein [Mycobacterium sp. KBS0706]TSD87477.1 AbrB/MazE/SpoVT family DNA-binding domain-containing protein [Mycobacterium sp. KBS0706]
MDDTAIAKLFQTGRSQAVRLPKEFRFPGKEVRVRRLGRGVLLEPMERSAEDLQAIFAELARYRDVPFMEEGRQQPPMPPAGDVSLDEEPGDDEAGGERSAGE